MYATKNTNNYSMTAFATLVTSTMILITSLIGYIYDIIAKKNQKNESEEIHPSELYQRHLVIS